MPSILNLKFKGNKSFVPFSNLSDADSLTKTWKVCTKVASFLEQGQRLENLSWRLWHLQNLMVDTDNAKSKREFKKLSKCMGDKLDKEKGRSIEELQAPGFKRNHSTDMIQQRAVEKERERQAQQNGRPGIQRMQFTFSVDQPATPTASAAPAKKPDLKPSAEFRDSHKRGRPNTRSTATDFASSEVSDRDPPLTQRGRRLTTDSQNMNDNDSHNVTLRFPSLFSSDFGPSALLYPTPTLTNGMNYGEGVGLNTSADGFSIPRPTIELPLDELLNADSPGGWSSSAFSNTDSRTGQTYNGQEDVDMKTAMPDGHFPESAEPQHDEPQHYSPPSNLRSMPAALQVSEDVVPRTITPSRLGPDPTPAPSASPVSTKRPSLHLRTQSVSTRSSGPSATPVNGGASSGSSSNNSAPGGVKAECSNCGATHTPLWRRGLNDELNCNACGLYCKLHKRPRPKSMRNNHGEGRSQTAPRQESQEVVAQCYNCHTTATPLWRKDDEGKTVCNACGLYYKLHGSARPISMKSDVIRKRARHDARRSGGTVSETPSASPGASRRASPTADTPILAPDSTTQMNYDDGFSSVQSELMNALGSQHHQNGGHEQFHGHFYSNFPGPYHPDYLNQMHVAQDALPFSTGDTSDYDSSDYRSSKRRRMSNDSASEPPSSAISAFSSYSEYSTSASSVASHSQRSSMEFPFSSGYGSYAFMRGNGNSSLWHPPMLPPDSSPHSFVHPPMLPQGSEDTSMDFLHSSVHNEDTDALFATYLHPPMLRPDDSPKVSMNMQLHPPMLPQEWGSHEFYDSSGSMQTY
ncbi:hypothetical protein BXZ70DRAFT_898471 [Cristinia sonorae]|uniref:GATA-type domain-containing protein n=1 Tax=Cristinia sonorae TaxID=1940300 RepID=A0A8K0UHG9_9AGAR|nr:hypothetical protein BXZ70DRAFT_898471 [Cristinia sonorae]